MSSRQGDLLDGDEDDVTVFHLATTDSLVFLISGVG